MLAVVTQFVFTRKLRKATKSVFRCSRVLLSAPTIKKSHTSRITVRKIASGVGVEKSFLIHSPLIEKIEIVRRAKVRRKFLSFLRQRSGKSARLTAKNFDRAAVNDIHDAKAEAEAERLKEEAAQAAAAKQAEKDAAQAELDAKAAEVAARHKDA